MTELGKDYRDYYSRAAKLEGYRARSAYKLLEIDENFNLFENVKHAVDLCAAPGSWSQVLARKLGKKPDAIIVSIDLQPVGPIEGVTVIEGDICSSNTLKKIEQVFGGNRNVELVICDGSPDIEGLRSAGEDLQLLLLCSALRVSLELLVNEGTLVCKIFKGPNFHIIREFVSVFFTQIYFLKPRCSREASSEHFLIARGLRIPADYNLTLDSTMEEFYSFVYESLDN